MPAVVARLARLAFLTHLHDLAARNYHEPANSILNTVGVMDPVSIFSAVGATTKIVCSVSIALYSFVSSAKTVDKSLGALHGEVDGLHEVLRTVETTLRDSVISRSKDASSLPQ